MVLENDTDTIINFKIKNIQKELNKLASKQISVAMLGTEKLF